MCGALGCTGDIVNKENMFRLKKVGIGMEKRKVYRKREFTAPREEIAWCPTIKEEQCQGCRICYEFCFKKVYDFDETTKKAKVVRPYECVVLCSGCAPKCPHQAILFPKREDFEHYVRYLEEEV